MSFCDYLVPVLSAVAEVAVESFHAFPSMDTSWQVIQFGWKDTSQFGLSAFSSGHKRVAGIKYPHRTGPLLPPHLAICILQQGTDTNSYN